MLGIGQSAEPESLNHNPQLYPQMFPWLFPYGLGGLINSASGCRPVSEERRKQQLLMYHDKHFQLEPLFPLVALNHEQIKKSTTAGYLLADKNKFGEIAKLASKYYKSPAFVSAFPSFWDAITVQEHKSNNHHLNLLLMRSQIMATVGSAWTWLDVQFPAMCRAIPRDEGECVCPTSADITLTIHLVDKQSAPWLHRLVQDVKKAHCLCGVVQLDPLSYDLHVPSTAARTFNFSDDETVTRHLLLNISVTAERNATM